MYAAYDAAVRHTGQPTVILAKTIKGYGMGQAGEGRNITHQQKSMNEEARLAIRDRLGLHLTDEEATGAFFHRPDESSPELRYLMERRAALGGSLPARRAESAPLPTPDATGTTNLANSGGKVAVVRSTTALSCGAAVGSCSADANVVDLIGYGSATDYEGSDAAPALSNTTADLRADGGCADTDMNESDFTVEPPAPRNSATTAALCSGGPPPPD